MCDVDSMVNKGCKDNVFKGLRKCFRTKLTCLVHYEYTCKQIMDKECCS